MQEISFSIPVSGTIRIDENLITIVVNKAETTVSFQPEPKKDERIRLPKGESLFDVVLVTAQQFVTTKKQYRFSSADLYHEVVRTHPDIKRNSWGAHVIASSSNHPSQKHYGARRDYFNYLGKGMYGLNSKYLFLKEDNKEED
jgi:hypothetical protein